MLFFRGILLVFGLLSQECFAERRTYRTPYRGPVVAQGQAKDVSGSEQHERVGRFQWGVRSQSERERGYQHQTDGSYYRDREQRTTEGYYRTPYGNGDSVKRDQSGSDRYYSHGGDSSQIGQMYRTENAARIQRLRERLASIDSSIAQTTKQISINRSTVEQVKSKLTAEELRGMHEFLDRMERELSACRQLRNECQAELRSLGG